MTIRALPLTLCITACLATPMSAQAQGVTAPSPASLVVRPQDPKPPFPYVASDVAFVNRTDGTRLAGTLTLPEGDGPFPAALLLNGAGPQDRDYSVLGHRFFLVLADHLSRRGIAVLRVDDRGTGGSTGDIAKATLGDATGDVHSAVAFLAAHPRIDARRIGLIGHSEGARVATEAMRGADRLAFLVLLSGPALGSDALFASQAAAAGDPATRIQLALMAMARDHVRREPDPAAAVKAAMAGLDAWMASLPAEQARVMRVLSTRDAFRPQVQQLIEALATPWNRSLSTIDPAPALEAVTVPVLALFGDRDRQVIPADHVPVLQAHWARHRDATVRVFPGLNHFLQHAQTGAASEFSQISETLAPEVLDAVAGWIRQRFNR